MNKLILAALSAGILSGCSSAPQLAVPKGEFVDLNTDITSLLPHTEPVYTEAKKTNETKQLLVKSASKAVVEGVQKNETTVVANKELNRPNVLISEGLKSKPITLRGFITPITTTAQNLKAKKSFDNSVPVKAMLPLVTPAAQSKILQPTIKIWEVKKGTTLIEGYMKWVENDKCVSGKGSKWRVDMQTDTNYSIDEQLIFHSASFEDATTQLFSLYRKAQVPLYVDGFRNQCLIVISDKSKDHKNE